MKKASQLLMVLSAFALVMGFMVSCTTDSGNGGNGGDTSIWETVYMPLEDGVTDLSRAVNTLHLHVNAGSVEIQKVFVNTVKSTDGAKYILDFTQTAGEPEKYFGDAGGYWYNLNGDEAAFEAFVQDGGTPDGRFVLSSDGEYVYGGGFASPAAYDNNANYWGFIIKKDTVLGDARFTIFAGDTQITAHDGEMNFSDLVK
ncbi:MAG: hypothetical protein FWF29_08540 [Treponema sp.]|nr:hypothetical protein [Treponema sp.]